MAYKGAGIYGLYNVMENKIYIGQSNNIEKILTEVIKSFQLNKLNSRKSELINKLSNTNTNEERELLESELNEVITKLGQLMIR